MRILVARITPFLLAFGAATAFADDQAVIVKIPRLTVETAQKIAHAALLECRKGAAQVGVTVVDRGGHPVVVLRDTLAADLTLEVSREKAYTAMSFNAPTSTLGSRFPKPFSIGKVPGLLFEPGGIPIAAAGNIVGGVGVSGAASEDGDEKCANAGLQAVQFDLEAAGP